MSTIKSSAEDLTLNADGANEIKFQINAVEKASINSSGLLTSTTIDATALTGNLPAINGASLTGIETVTKSATVPGSPSEGDQWFNTSVSTVSGVVTKAMAVYNGTDWTQLSNVPFSATGGTITTSGGYKYHAFTSSGTFTPNGDKAVDIVIVGGGGAGGRSYGDNDNGKGGGGAGGVAFKSGHDVSAQGYTITIGAGGTGSTSENSNSSYGQGVSGADTVAFGVTAKGGSGGNGADCYGAGSVAGGSGGGGGEARYEDRGVGSVRQFISRQCGALGAVRPRRCPPRGSNP